MRFTGKFRSARMETISRPTLPVAPMTAMLWDIREFLGGFFGGEKEKGGGCVGRVAYYGEESKTRGQGKGEIEAEGWCL